MSAMKAENEIGRFMAMVEPVTESGCWLWTGALKNKFGHGSFTVRSRKVGSWKTCFSHRYSFQTFISEIPNGKCVLHKCDIPSCVNPDHLYLGDKKQNKHDSMSRGRSIAGAKHWKAKLSDDKVREIMRKIERGISAVSIEFGVSKSTIADIFAGRTWKHITSKLG